MMKPQEEDDDFLSELGSFQPLSAEYLLERGYCCGNGCKHCPYEYKGVPSPQREQLLKKRKEREDEKEDKR